MTTADGRPSTAEKDDHGSQLSAVGGWGVYV
jgi:hypothetical protein